MSQVSLEHYFLRHEIIQAYIRVIFIAVLAVLFIYATISGHFYAPAAHLFLCLFAAIAFMHLFGLKRLPASNTRLRKFFILHVDIFSTLLTIWVLNAYGPLFIFAFIWVIIGYTLRFGKVFLPVALFSSVASIFFLSLFHPYWLENPVISLTASIAVMVIPLFVFRLTREIHKKNEELYKLLKKSDYLAHHDMLTQLPNRTFFYEYLDEKIWEGGHFNLLFIDLDGFKSVNDSYGHEIGDGVLLEASGRMKGILPEHDFIARLGGDEFVVVTQHSDIKVSELCRRLITAVSRPYRLDEATIDSLSASIGVSSYPDDTTESFLLKKYADNAMYHAKEEGKNCFRFYRQVEPGGA